jgi:MraZ protein
MFMGTVYNSIDEKNRMIVPAKLRANLGNRCILTKGLDRCLYIYAVQDWEEQMAKISKLPESDPKVRAFIRHFCANATECEFDRQGRIVIPQELKGYADIEKELVTMGAMSKIEVWSKAVWDTASADTKMNGEDFANALSEYNF